MDKKISPMNLGWWDEVYVINGDTP